MVQIHIAQIDVEIFYHLCCNNLGSELESIHRLSREMDFRFTAFPAHTMPMENYLYLKNGSLGESAHSIPDEYLIHPEVLLTLDELQARRNNGRQSLVNVRDFNYQESLYPVSV
jgi:hypothetical protein